MITIVVASVNPELLSALRRNIEETIGIPYEVIAIDNRFDNRGICEIYNIGAQQANFEIVCYTHEDVLFVTNNWGRRVVDIFNKNALLGVIGVAGSAYKSAAPSGWGTHRDQTELNYLNYIQHYKRTTKEKHHIHLNPSNTPSIVKVVSVDGMWFCTRRRIVIENPFDENLLKGFHCYDLQFCLSLFNKYEVAVTYDILIEHFSEGSYNVGWIQDTLKLHKNFRHLLPISTVKVAKKEQKNIEKRTFKYFLKLLADKNHTILMSYALLTDYLMSSSQISLKLFIKLSYYVLKYRIQR